MYCFVGGRPRAFSTLTLLAPTCVRWTSEKSADHVGQEVGSRIADLVQRLFGDHRRNDQAAGAVRLGDNEASVASALGDRIADIVPIGHALPIAERSACRLRTAFQDMADQAAGTEAVVVVGRPAELVHQNAERKRAVGAAAGNDNIGAALERRLDGKRAQIGIGGQQARRQPFTRNGFAQTVGAKLVDQWHDVVAFDHGDASATGPAR